MNIMPMEIILLLFNFKSATIATEQFHELFEVRTSVAPFNRVQKFRAVMKFLWGNCTYVQCDDSSQ